MSKFSEWVDEKKGKEQQVDEIMQPETLTAAAGAGVADLRVKAAVKRRLQWLFDELDGYKLSRPAALQLLTIVIKEFEKDFGLDQVQQRRAIQMANNPNMN